MWITTKSKYFSIFRNQYTVFHKIEIPYPTNTKTIFTNKSTISKMPIAHNEGNYFANSNQIKEIEDNDQIAFQYCDENGDINAHSNPNGSINNIAGVFNKSKNVLGMMPHPERAAESIHGCDDGRNIFESLLS